jgi:hypothetical protein
VLINQHQDKVVVVVPEVIDERQGAARGVLPRT